MSIKSILVVALCLNIGVVAVYFFRSPPAPGETAAKTSNKPRFEKKNKSSAAAEPIKVIQQIDWRMVESEDYKNYIANLRSIGCPEETIKDIIVADVNKLFDSKRKALRKPGDGFKFWKPSMQPRNGATMNGEVERQQKELVKEKRAVLKELLGIELVEKPDMLGFTAVTEYLLDFLTPAKQARVMELMQEHQTKTAGMKRTGNDAEDRKELQSIEKENEAEMARLLTPQEKEEYDLRMSFTAVMMRVQLMQMPDFEPSEQEFRDIFKLKKQMYDDFGRQSGLMTTDKDELAKRDVAYQELEGKLNTVLGDARYAEYQRGLDPVYVAMSKVAESQGLTKEFTVRVYDMKKAAEEQANQLRTNTSLSNEQRQSALQSIRTATEQSIIATFGQKGFDSYQNQQWASWLKSISPDAPTPVPTK